MPQTDNETRILLALQAYKNDPKLSLRRAAKLHQVNYSTLLYRHDGVQARANTIPKTRKLSDIEEQNIIQFILDLDSRGFPLRLRNVEEMANRLLAGRDAPPVGESWARNFVRRHNELETRFGREYYHQRAKCEDPITIRNWFRLVQSTIAKYGIQSDDIYNFDEASFLMGMIESGMVVTGSERRAKPKLVQPEIREWITVIQAINAKGWAIPPVIIITGQYHLACWYQESTLPGDWAIMVAPNGCVDNETSLEWIKHFDQHTAKRSRGDHRLLILDGHGSHHSTDFEMYCEENNIITLCMPLHLSHLLQPFDVGCFDGLKKAYDREMKHLIRSSTPNVSKMEFFPAFFAAFQAAMTERNIKTAFRRAGLAPFNPESVVSKLGVQLQTPTPVEEEAGPSTPWISNTTNAILRANSQSERPGRRIRRHHSSSPESILKVVKSFSKINEVVMREIARLRAENQDLRQENAILSRHQRTKRTRVQKRGVMTREEGRQAIDQMDVDVQAVAESSGSGGQERSARPRERCCGVCGKPGHNARTCQVVPETSGEECSS